MSLRSDLEQATGTVGQRLTITDLKNRYYKANSGLTRGGLSNHRAAFYRKRAGITRGTISDAFKRAFPDGIEKFIEPITYAWEGTQRLSSSVMKQGATILRRQDAIDPQFTTQAQWNRNGKTTTSVSEPRRYKITVDTELNSSDILTYPNINLPASPGDIKAARYTVTNAGTAMFRIFGATRAYTGAGAGNGDSANAPLLEVNPGQTVTLTMPAFTIPGGSAGYRPLLRSGSTIPVGTVIYVSEPMFETVAAGGAPGTYFDGDGPAPIVTDPPEFGRGTFGQGAFGR